MSKEPQVKRIGSGVKGGQTTTQQQRDKFDAAKKQAANTNKPKNIESYLLQYSKSPLPRAGKDIKWPFPGGKQILIDNSQRVLVLVNGNGTARIYDCAVGTSENQWVGTYKVDEKLRKPSWTPTANQKKKNPKLKTIPGGRSDNPKGWGQVSINMPAVHIHGINETKAKLNSIGTAASDGCIRMFNEGIKDLYARVGVGLKVQARA